MKNRMMGGLVVAGTVLASVVMAVPANAATGTGNTLCSGTRWPQVTSNLTGAGSLRSTNYDNANQSKRFDVPAGAANTFGGYQRHSWVLTAPGFYSSPTGSCY